jgi:hypothetical protein
MNLIDAWLDRARPLRWPVADGVVCHTPQPIPPVDDDDEEDEDDRGSGGGGDIDPDDDEGGGFDDDDDDDEDTLWTAATETEGSGRALE